MCDTERKCEIRFTETKVVYGIACMQKPNEVTAVSTLKKKTLRACTHASRNFNTTLVSATMCGGTFKISLLQK